MAAKTRSDMAAKIVSKQIRSQRGHVLVASLLSRHLTSKMHIHFTVWEKKLGSFMGYLLHAMIEGYEERTGHATKKYSNLTVPNVSGFALTKLKERKAGITLLPRKSASVSSKSMLICRCRYGGGRHPAHRCCTVMPQESKMHFDAEFFNEQTIHNCNQQHGA